MQKSRHCARDRNIEFILVKKEEGPFWPQLMKQKVKYHWLKIDFAKWKDEDDSEDEGGNQGDLEEVILISYYGTILKLGLLIYLKLFNSCKQILRYIPIIIFILLCFKKSLFI